LYSPCFSVENFSTSLRSIDTVDTDILIPLDQVQGTALTVSQINLTINSGPSSKDPFNLNLTLPVIEAKFLLEKLKELIEEESFRKTNHQRFESLTNRETEILQLLAEGHNNPQIANKLFISRRTVEQHRKNINRKLEIRSYADIAMYQRSFLVH